MIAAPPEPAQLIKVCRRQWVVTDAQASELARMGDGTPQHFITLASLDEDALDGNADQRCGREVFSEMARSIS